MKKRREQERPIKKDRKRRKTEINEKIKYISKEQKINSDYTNEKNCALYYKTLIF